MSGKYINPSASTDITHNQVPPHGDKRGLSYLRTSSRPLLWREAAAGRNRFRSTLVILGADFGSTVKVSWRLEGRGMQRAIEHRKMDLHLAVWSRLLIILKIVLFCV